LTIGHFSILEKLITYSTYVLKAMIFSIVKKKAQKWSFLSALLICMLLPSCNDPVDELPAGISIKILSIDLPKREVSLVATQPSGGIKGQWSVISVNQHAGVFSNVQDPLTNFIGDVFEQYKLRWTLTNGKQEVFSEVDVMIGKGFSIAELSDGGVLIGEFRGQGITDPQLEAAGVSGHLQILMVICTNG
jgi:hypothetical protein